MKKERLPPHIQAQLGYKPTAPKPVHTKVEKKLEKVPEAIPTASAIAEIEKETKLNLKNDFHVDYTESANVYVKIKEIQEERSRGKFNPNYHAKLLSFMLE